MASAAIIHSLGSNTALNILTNLILIAMLRGGFYHHYRLTDEKSEPES